MEKGRRSTHSIADWGEIERSIGALTASLCGNQRRNLLTLLASQPLPLSGSLRVRPFEVEGEQAFEDLFIG